MSTDHPGSRRARVAVIAAVARNGVIGVDNRLPWRLPEDLKRFKALTMGHPIIMGRKTWESLCRPLPGRRNLVITRNPEYRAAGAETHASLHAALEACPDEEVFVIGGAELYAAALPLAERLYLTEIAAEVPGDTHFPLFDRTVWTELSREHGHDGAGFAWDFVVYARQGSN